MADKQVRFDIDVNAAKAEQGLRQFTRGVKRATKEAQDGLDDTATSADKVAKALKDMAGQMDSELRQAAKAADALAQALGPELASKLDVGNEVIELNKMGLAFKDIEAEADKLAAAMREIDGIRVDQASAGLDDMRTKMDGVRNSSDQSRSVLANMAGNAAQDLGQLGGVVGTLGVGIGQLAEYAVDGNIKLSQLANVAGPMAGLAAATLLVQQAMANVAKTKAFNADEVESFVDAIEEAGVGVQAVNDKLQETQAITGLIEDSNPFTAFTDAEVDITPMLDEFGLTLEQVSAVIADTGEAAEFMVLTLDGVKLGFHGVTPELANFVDLMNAANVPMSTQVDIIRVLQQQQKNYRDGVEETGTAAEFFASTLQDVNRAMLGVSNTQRQMDNNWGIILDDLRDGTIETANARDAWNILRDALKLTDDEMAELADQKMAELLGEEADAATEAAEAQREHAAALRDAALATAEATAAINDAISAEAPDLAGALADELDEVDKIFDGLAFDESFDAALDEALDALDNFGPDLQTLADRWADILEGDEIELFGNVRADDTEFLAKVQPLIDLFQEGTVNAFEQGGADAADTFAQSMAARIAEATGLNIADVYKLMGLPPDGSIQALIQPTIDEAAAAKAEAILDALAGVSEDPRIAELQIALLTDNVDPEIAALAAQLLAYELHIGVKPTVDEQTTQAEIDEAQRIVDANPITVPATVTIAEVISNIGGLFDKEDTEATVAGPVIEAVPDMDDVTKAFDDFVAEDREATIKGDADLSAATSEFNQFVATERTATIKADADTATANTELNTVANPATPRKAIIHVDYLDYEVLNVETILEQLAKDRTATIHVVTSGGGGGGGGGGGAGPEPVMAGALTAGPTALTAAPAALSISPVTMTPTAPSVSNTTVNVRAGAFTSRFDIQRTVARALRQSQRLNGRRSA